jgi:hypothetical protein
MSVNASGLGRYTHTQTNTTFSTTTTIIREKHAIPIEVTIPL